MENESCEQSATTSGIPRGGPIYLPKTVGHLSTIPEFQSSFLDLLQDLETHLSPESPSSSQQYDVSTDALRVYTEEELTDMAMKEAFKDDNISQNELEQSLIVSPPENPPARRVTKAKRKRTVKKTEDDNISQNELEQSLVVSQPKNPPGRRVTKAKRNRTVEKTEDDNCSQNELEQSLIVSHPKNPPARRVTKAKRKRTMEKTEEPYLAKVEELAKIKEKQEEDKATVRLHCFSKTCENIKDVAAAQEGSEQMQSLKYIDNYMHVKPSDIQGQVDPLFPEVILCVEVYNSRKSKTQEFLVLGRQMLTELKDKIHCVTDQVMDKAGRYDHSGYFLIEDVFYNDLRNPSAIDYSKPILDYLWNSKDEAFEKWEHLLTGGSQRKQKAAVLCQAKSKDLPRFESVDMQMTRFCDLKFRVGAKYLYCHQGDCKHRIVIRDMRLSHREDVQSRLAYPRLAYQMKARVQKCSSCNIYRATKVALEFKWSKENPCYFCVACFAKLHLGEEEEEVSLNYHFPVLDYLYD